MKKLNLIIGKRQIIIITLLITLGIAAALNFQFATSDQAVTVMDISDKNDKNSSTKKANNETTNPTYGEAEAVSNNNYFTRARLTQKACQDEKKENLNKLLSSQNLTQEQRAEITDKALKLNEQNSQINSIVSQVKSKGFENCIAYIDETNGTAQVTVGVKDNIEPDEVAQIKNIVVDVTGFSASNIVVNPTKAK